MPRFRLVPVVQAVLFAQLALLAPLHLARAQRPDSTVARVQRLVNAGDRAAARALADSILQGATEGTPGYAEALYARAFASSSAVEAERDYLRVSVEYPFSPRAEDATMMVAQLKLARSDRIGARRNFERLVREHPDGALTAKAAFWAGRLAVEDGELARGCQSLGTSRARVSTDDVELANQIEYYSQRCSAGALAAAAPADTAVATSTGAAKGVKDATPAPKSARERAKERADAARAEKARLETARKEAARIEKERIAAERARVAAERVAADSAAAAAALAAVPSKEFSVQVAAFPKERDAQALREVLQQRGYEARVWGTKAPFRVRVGRYVTREAADAALARMKASRLNGMVVEAEPQ